MKPGIIYEVQGQVIDGRIHGYCMYATGPMRLETRSAAIDLVNMYGSITL